MPPAVEAEPPPTNMSMEPTTVPDPYSSPMSTNANPPERVIEERKSAWKRDSPKPIEPNVCGLSYSRIRNAAAPPTSSRPEVMSVSFTCNDHVDGRQKCDFFGWNRWRESAKITGKPTLPTMTASMITVMNM